jgi:hypothetical protein
VIEPLVRRIFFPNFVYWKRPFVQEGFEDREITAAHLETLDTFFCIGVHRPAAFHSTRNTCTPLPPDNNSHSLFFIS